MMRFNLNRHPEPGVWSRLLLQAKRAHSLTKDPTSTALRGAVDAMRLEQRKEGLALGLTMCEYDDCPHAAANVWVRTPADLKSMRRKYKGQWLVGQPEVIHCAVHTSQRYAVKYQPLETIAARRAA
jgi:hypothetical protein